MYYLYLVLELVAAGAVVWLKTDAFGMHWAAPFILFGAATSIMTGAVSIVEPHFGVADSDMHRLPRTLWGIWQTVTAIAGLVVAALMIASFSEMFSGMSADKFTMVAGKIAWVVLPAAMVLSPIVVVIRVARNRRAPNSSTPSFHSPVAPTSFVADDSIRIDDD